MPMAALQFKFHPSGFVTDRHRVPNSDERNLTNGIRYVNDRSPVNDQVRVQIYFNPVKIARLYFLTGK